jgi:gamma-glutamylaminecyclotransferase
MIRVLAVGTLKRGFPLNVQGLADATYLGEYRMRERFPMIIAGPCPMIITRPWHAPGVLHQPGTGLQIRGELYEITDASRRYCVSTRWSRSVSVATRASS